MENILTVIFSESFIPTVLRVTTPILLAALAALIPRLAGVTNIGVEGVMLFSSLFAVIFSAATHNIWIGLLGGFLIGIAVTMFMALFIIRLKTDGVLAGVAVNLMGSGGTVFVLYTITGEKGITSALNSGVLPNVDIPILKSIPVLGSLFSGHNIVTYLALAAVVICYLFLFKTPLGLSLRAVGENPNAAISVGVKTHVIQYIAFAISGGLAGLGGVYMSMGYVSWFSTNITAGRGFIGIAAQAMGGSSPFGTLLVSLLFGTTDAVATFLQSLQIPAELVTSIPYASTIIGFVVYSVIKEKKKKKSAIVNPTVAVS